MSRGVRFALIAVAALMIGIGGGALIFGALLASVISGIFDPAGGDDRGDPPEPQRIAFLQHEGFDASAPGAALILHPLATGDETLAITDPARLAAAAPQAYYTDDPGRELGLTLLSIVFLSPPTSATSQPFATLFVDGREVATFTCFRLHCSDPEAPRDLAGLDSAGRPAEFAYETVTGITTIRAREAAIHADPARLLLTGADQLPGVADRFPGFVPLRLPTVFAPVEADTSFDFAPLEARISQALSEALARAAIPAEVEAVQSGGAWTGLQLMRGATHATDANGYLITPAYLPSATPTARIWLAQADAPRLDAALASLPAFGPTAPPDAEALAPWVAAAVADHGLDGAAGDFHLDHQLWSPARGLSLGTFREPDVTLTFYRIAE